MHAPLVDENMAIWLEGVVDGLHMMLDQLNIDSSLPGRDRREPAGDPEAIWMAQEAERERNRKAMRERQERKALPAPVDPQSLRDQAETIILQALDGRELDSAAAEFIRIVGNLIQQT